MLLLSFFFSLAGNVMLFSNGSSSSTPFPLIIVIMLLGDKSPFSQLNLQRDTMDRDEETARIQYLAEIAMFLGITSTLDTEVIQVGTLGQGSYEDRTEKLRLIVGHVEASRYANNLEWSTFADQMYLSWRQLAEQSKILLNLQQKVNDLASKHAYNPDEEYAEVESQLQAHLESFLEIARSFNVIYTKEIRPWTHMMEVPQLHGFGLAANRLLEAYKMLLKIRNMKH
ncbi:hypothetical protein POTOM_059125 [Populus tomentosa]|uniref:Uncharacterized protein n=1 Tax=Populus tomentosa TaxID=118781 RepID=A0A8X7XVJ9_POPTO|nr:hypothetical protein POTOM_059125 [Populus tomentosa]